MLRTFIAGLIVIVGCWATDTVFKNGSLLIKNASTTDTYVLSQIDVIRTDSTIKIEPQINVNGTFIENPDLAIDLKTQRADNVTELYSAIEPLPSSSELVKYSLIGPERYDHATKRPTTTISQLTSTSVTATRRPSSTTPTPYVATMRPPSTSTVSPASVPSSLHRRNNTQKTKPTIQATVSVTSSPIIVQHPTTKPFTATGLSVASQIQPSVPSPVTATTRPPNVVYIRRPPIVFSLPYILRLLAERRQHFTFQNVALSSPYGTVRPGFLRPMAFMPPRPLMPPAAPQVMKASSRIPRSIFDVSIPLPSEVIVRSGQILHTNPTRMWKTRLGRRLSFEDSDVFWASNVTMTTKLGCNDGRMKCGSRFCSCDSSCVKFGDCCLEMVTKLQTLAGSLSNIDYSVKTLEKMQCTSLGDSCFFMISSCPKVNETERRCFNNSDPFFSLPVTSAISGYTYRNIHCARCNQDINALIFWDVNFHCINPEKERNCPYKIFPPTFFPTKLAKTSIRECNCFTNYSTSVARKTMIVDNMDVSKKISILCDLVYLPVVQTKVSSCENAFLKNRFCAYANNKTADQLRCVPIGNDPICPSKNPNDLILRNNNMKFVQLSKSPFQNHCRPGCVFDPWKNTCRSVKLGVSCSVRKIRFNIEKVILALQHYKFLALSVIALLAISILSHFNYKLEIRSVYSVAGLDDVTLCFTSSILCSHLLLYFVVSYPTYSCMCWLLGAVTHFCIISSFAWSNIYLYELWSFTTFRSSSSTVASFSHYCLYSWVLPAAVVVIGVIFQTTLPTDNVFSPCYSSDKLCFLSGLTAFITLLVIPLFIFLVVDIFVVIGILKNIRHWWKCRTFVPYRVILLGMILPLHVTITWLLAFIAGLVHTPMLWKLFVVCYLSQVFTALIINRTFEKVFNSIKSICCWKHTLIATDAKRIYVDQNVTTMKKAAFVKL